MITGPFLIIDNKLCSITIEDVKMHIGLNTNVCLQMSDTQFYRRMMLHAEGIISKFEESREGCVSAHAKYANFLSRQQESAQ